MLASPGELLRIVVNLVVDFINDKNMCQFELFMLKFYLYNVNQINLHMTFTERICTEFLPKFKTYKGRGDYNCYGFEAIMNLRPDYDGFISYEHQLPEGFETWLYYAPSDYRMVLIDFSNIDKGTIDLRDGSNQYAQNREVIHTLTIDEFLDYYGSKIIMSVGHWQVKWNAYGVGWNN